VRSYEKATVAVPPSHERFREASSGLYESARDFVHADELAGRQSVFVDTGARINGVHQAPKAGATDERGGWTLRTVGPREAADADVWVWHDLPSAEVQGLSSAPIISILHGRPESGLLMELANPGLLVYTYFVDQGRQDRIKIQATMIREHMPYWRNVLPESKLRLIDHPPVDPARFSPGGPLWDVPSPGDNNVLICDSWREDVGIFNALNACCIAAESIPRLKVWIMGVAPASVRSIAPLLGKLRDLGAVNGLGNIYARTPRMDDVYRSADVLLTEHVIPTRVMTEALACGCEVVAASGCRYTEWTADPSDPGKTAAELGYCFNAMDARGWHSQNYPRKHNLTDFSARMGELYEEAIGKKEAPIVVQDEARAATLDVIVPCYGQAELTQRFVDSFGDHAPEWAQLILIDNGATGLCSWGFSPLVIEISRNLGFIRAVNMGLCASDAEFVCIQNNDTEIYAGCYEELVGTLQANPEFGVICAVGPNEKRGVGWSYEDLREKGHLPGDAPEDNAERAAWMRAAWTGQALDSGFVPFFCVVLRRSVVDKIGLLDTRFGLGLGDDDDYCRRLREAGLKVGLARGCYVEHTGRATFDANFSKEEQAEMSQKAGRLLAAKYA